MNLKHFGDAYDIVKKSLLQWLAPFGPWGVHPMFTHEVSVAEAAQFSEFLGAPVLSTDVLRLTSRRGGYLGACGDCRSVFLDPDTGVRLHRRQRHRATEFVFDEELLALTVMRPDGLVMVFDQSIPRGGEAAQTQTKLDHFARHGVSGFAYVSQACFLILSQSEQLAHVAREQVIASSGLPDARILAVTPRGGARLSVGP